VASFCRIEILQKLNKPHSAQFSAALYWSFRLRKPEHSILGQLPPKILKILAVSQASGSATFIAGNTENQYQLTERLIGS
jgi:hypothetical protein